ncbi:hypothetical protein KKF55_01920 [Patescibacteria group bacterium]|nr:hypothetical protein [Patescibacteria group bacterium]
MRVDEVCDDGNTDPNDGCSAICEIENGWSCNGEPSICAEGCGNGRLDINLGEGCDDGNTRSGDGCAASCAIEHGYQCSSSPSSCSLLQPLDDIDLKNKNSRWTLVLNRGFNGGFYEHKKTTQALWNSPRIMWELPSIGQGKYQVLAAWQHSTSNGWEYVDFRVSIEGMDGIWRTSSFNINQKKAPNGSKLGGVPWQNIGVLDITEPVRRIRMSFLVPDSKYWTVDAVRLVPIQ